MQVAVRIMSDLNGRVDMRAAAAVVALRHRDGRDDGVLSSAGRVRMTTAPGQRVRLVVGRSATRRRESLYAHPEEMISSYLEF